MSKSILLCVTLLLFGGCSLREEKELPVRGETNTIRFYKENGVFISNTITYPTFMAIVDPELRDILRNHPMSQSIQENNPIMGVTWIDAMYFCEELTSYAHSINILLKDEVFQLPTIEELDSISSRKLKRGRWIELAIDIPKDDTCLIITPEKEIRPLSIFHDDAMLTTFRCVIRPRTVETDVIHDIYLWGNERVNSFNPKLRRSLRRSLQDGPNPILFAIDDAEEQFQWSDPIEWEVPVEIEIDSDDF